MEKNGCLEEFQLMSLICCFSIKSIADLLSLRDDVELTRLRFSIVLVIYLFLSLLIQSIGFWSLFFLLKNLYINQKKIPPNKGRQKKEWNRERKKYVVELVSPVYIRHWCVPQFFPFRSFICMQFWQTFHIRVLRLQFFFYCITAFDDDFIKKKQSESNSSSSYLA